MAVDLTRMVGQCLQSVEKLDHTWCFSFTAGCCVCTEGLWRLVADSIKVTSEDHGHRFGLPQPVDAVAMLREYVVGRCLAGVRVDESTGDLRLSFDGGMRVECLQTSAGYEGWQLSAGALNVICCGGGKLIVLSEQ